MYLFKKYIKVYTTMNLTKFLQRTYLMSITSHSKTPAPTTSYGFLLTTSAAVMYSYPVMDP